LTFYQGSEFVDWLETTLLWMRTVSVRFGEYLIQRGIISHAANAQPFRDGNFFYVVPLLPRLNTARDKMRSLDEVLQVHQPAAVVAVMSDFEAGVPMQLRTIKKKEEMCFTGKDAIDWLVTNLRLRGRLEAMFWVKHLQEKRIIVPFSKAFRDKDTSLLRFNKSNPLFKSMTLDLDTVKALLENGDGNIVLAKSPRFVGEESSEGTSKLSDRTWNQLTDTCITCSMSSSEDPDVFSSDSQRTVLSPENRSKDHYASFSERNSVNTSPSTFPKTTKKTKKPTVTTSKSMTHVENKLARKNINSLERVSKSLHKIEKSNFTQ